MCELLAPFVECVEDTAGCTIGDDNEMAAFLSICDAIGDSGGEPIDMSCVEACTDDIEPTCAEIESGCASSCSDTVKELVATSAQLTCDFGATDSGGGAVGPSIALALFWASAAAHLSQ